MKPFLLSLLLLFAMLSCNDKPVTKANTADSTVYAFDNNDTNVNLAMSKAKNTFPKFDSAFRNHKYDSGTCAVKLRFDAKNNMENVKIEHLWATEITYENGNYYGVMDQPHFTTEVKSGQKVKIDPEKVSDWMYAEKGILRGGYTIRATRNKMPEQQRVHFDATYPFKIEN